MFANHPTGPAVAISLLLFIVTHAAAQPPTVVHVPKEAKSIQEAIEMVAAGGTINVSPGTYYESIVIESKSVTIIGIKGARETIIHGSPDTVVIRAWYMQHFMLEGLTITGGNGGIDLETWGTAIVSDCKIVNNRNQPGILARTETALLVTHSHIWNNGGRDVYGGGISTEKMASLVLQYSTVVSNDALQGGGIYAAPLSITAIVASEIRCNRAAADGGGVWASESTTTISSSIIGRNVASANGGGVYGHHVLLTVTCSAIEHNKATNGGGVFVSAGMGADVDLSANKIFANHAGTLGGGVFLSGEFLQGTIDGCVISGNSAQSGGGIYAFDEEVKSLCLADSLLCENTPDHLVDSSLDCQGNDFLDACPWQAITSALMPSTLALCCSARGADASCAATDERSARRRDCLMDNDEELFILFDPQR